MMRGLVLAALAWAMPAAAFDIDYTLLMEMHADRVVRPSPGVRVLELPGPVIVTCTDGAGCTALDQSAHGAAGCAVEVLTAVAALDRLCPQVLGPDSRARLARALSEGWRFRAANAVPPRTMAEADAAREAAVATQAQGLCPVDGTGRGDGQRQMMLAITRETMAGRMAQVFDMPRLPVSNPCL